MHEQLPFDFESASRERWAWLHSALELAGATEKERAIVTLVHNKTRESQRPLSWTYAEIGAAFHRNRKTAKRWVRSCESKGLIVVIEQKHVRGGQRCHLLAIDWDRVRAIACRRGEPDHALRGADAQLPPVGRAPGPLAELERGRASGRRRVSRPVGRLIHDGGLYRYCYTRGAKMPEFRPFPGMEKLDQVYESETLFPLFANRLLPPSRPEYEDYLRWSGFDPDNPPQPIVVLGVTEGIRQTDAVEVFPCPAPDAQGCYLNRFFLHGIRWMGMASERRIETLQPGETLRLMLDMQNEVDPSAVALRTENDRTMIGYVPRYLASDVWKLIQNCEVDLIDLAVERVNPRAPIQNRLLCRMSACWPDDFRPCDGEEFHPLPADVPARCG